MSPRIVNKGEKKRAILLAGLDVFARKGFHNTTMQDVAVAAGIGKGTVYEYYSSKEQLFHSLIDLFMLAFEERLRSIVREDSDPVEQIVTSLLDILDEADEYVKLAPIFMEIMGLAQRGAAKDFLAQLMEWLERYCQLYEPIFRAGQSKGQIDPGLDPRVFIRTMVSALDGMILHYALLPDRAFLAAQRKELERILRGALRPPGGLR